MKKRYFLTLFFLLFLVKPLFSQEKQSVRYKGAGIGMYFCNSYPAGNWKEYIKTSLGCGLYLDYVLPFNLPKFDIGINIKEDWSFVTPKKENINSILDFTFLPGVYIRIPFCIGNFKGAFVPDLSYGLSIHNVYGNKDSNISGFYFDQLIGITTGFRFCIPYFEKLEIDTSHVSTFVFEDSNVITQVGFRIGFVYHFEMK
ncbi:MAG: hypothetical protein IK024_10010 [Treponema sp.]|nr:hypothetical protein [Treponema sp.]